MSQIKIFQEEHPSLESYWRSIILFGRNVASYKFALAKSLLEIIPTEKNELTLEELALPYAKNLCEHIAVAPKQVTSNSSQFLEACKNYNQDMISLEELLDITVKKGFNNVIDAFHVVNNGELPLKFYEKNFHQGKKIILTDNIFKLKEVTFFNNFMNEAEARWNLVETAWELGVSRNLLNIHYDNDSNLFFADNLFKRKDITSARDALNGYQKGKCFYCFDDISVESGSDYLCDVDHFFPHILQISIPQVNINGVWNLALSCTNCNRGENGKFAKVPSIKYLERLSKRNEFLISSHHPLRETLMQQVGSTTEERHLFLTSMDKTAINHLIHRWDTEQIGEAVF